MRPRERVLCQHSVRMTDLLFRMLISVLSRIICNGSYLGEDGGDARKDALALCCRWTGQLYRLSGAEHGVGEALPTSMAAISPSDQPRSAPGHSVEAALRAGATTGREYRELLPTRLCRF